MAIFAVTSYGACFCGVVKGKSTGFGAGLLGFESWLCLLTSIVTLGKSLLRVLISLAFTKFL